MFYFVIFILSFILYYICDRKGRNIKTSGWIGMLLVAFFLSFVAGVRDYGIGTDTMVYSEYYYYSANHYSLKDLLDDNICVGYFLLNQFSVSLYNDISSTWFFTELCILGGAFIVFKKFQKWYIFNYMLLIVLYIFLYYNQSFNYMRQLCAVTFTFAAYYCFVIKKYHFSVIWLLIAYQFHTSAIGGLIPLAIYRISNIGSPKKRKKLSVIFLLVLIIAVLVFNLLLAFLSNLGVLLDVYEDRYGANNTFGGDFSTSQVVFLALGYFLIYLSHKKNILSSKQNYLALLMHTTHMVMILMGLYAFFLFRIAFFISLPDLLWQVTLLSSKKVNSFTRYGYVLLAFLLWLNLYIIHNNCETNPYKSHILGIF